MRRPDIKAIRGLTARQVADHLSILDGDIKGSGDGARFRFAGYGGSHWIHFHQDGKWQNHKSNFGGDALSLVQSYLAGAPDFLPAHDKAHFGEAAEMIASAFGMWETLDEARGAAKKLASERPQGKNRHTYMQELAADLEAGTTSERRAQAERLLVGLEVDPHEVTFCPDAAGTGALCWQPAVPWQGVEISRKESGVFGGWTLERAVEYTLHHAALDLHVLDLDGIKGATPSKPSSGLIDRLVRDLRRAGLPVAAHVWTSFGEDDRAKAHLYFRAARGARSVEEWQARWDLLKEITLELVDRWSRVPELERELIRAIDPSTRQITRLVRLPGYPKWGARMAPVIESLDEGARVDFDLLREQRPLVHTWSPSDQKTVTTTFGDYCSIRIEKRSPGGSEPEVTHIPLARAFYPLARYVTHDGEDRGIYLRIEDVQGTVRYEPVSFGELVDKSRRISTGARLRRRGAQIWPEKDDALLKALSEVAFRGQPERNAQLVSRPGWHGESYVLGDEVIGPHRDVLPNASSVALQRRMRSSGTLKQWQEEVLTRCTTMPLKLAVGVSLAGALLRHLGQHPFVLHIAGPSSSGKSLAPEVAASIWSSPDVRGLCNRWDTTMGAFEALAELATDACLGMDEMARWRGSDTDLAQAIHALGDSGGRSRLEQRDGTYQLGQQRNWYCTTVSTGEVLVEDLLGDGAQGGHSVRMLDLRITREEMTHSRDHTRELRRACQLYHGTAARYWVEALTMIDWDSAHGLVGRLGDALGAALPTEDGEARRVIDIIALITIALRIGFECGLTPWDDEERRELAYWTVDRVVNERVRRSMHTPNHRMLRLLLRTIDADESLAPFLRGRELSARPQGMIGIREVLGEVGPEGMESHLFHTTESWLHASGLCAKAGVSSRTWLQWCEEEGVVIEHRRMRKAGRKAWFWTIDLDKADDLLQAPWNSEKCPGSGTPGQDRDADRDASHPHEMRV